MGTKNIKITLIKISDYLFRRSLNFIKNVWFFRKELSEYRRWDWLYQLSMFRRGLELQIEYSEKRGFDNFGIKTKKLKKMQRAVEIIKFHEEDLFIEFAENELGYKYKYEEDETVKLSYEDKERNAAINKKSYEIENDLWLELLEIIDGQDLSQVKTEQEWLKKFDGSGIKGWVE